MGAWVAAIGALAGAGSSIYGGSQSSKAAKAAGKAGRAPAKRLEEIMALLQSGSLFGLPTRDFTGSKPEIVDFERTDLGAEAKKALALNLENLPAAAELARQTNASTRAEDRARIEDFAPGFSQGLASQAASASELAAGRLPFDDVAAIVRDRAQLASFLGIGGTQLRGGALPRDLGLSRLEAIQRGGSSLSQLAATVGQFSSLSNQVNAGQFFFSPQEQAASTLQQNAADLDIRQQRASLAAAADPLASFLYGTEKERLNLYASGQIAGATAQQAAGKAWTGIGQDIGSTFNDLASLLIKNSSDNRRQQRPVVQAQRYNPIPELY